MESHGTLAYGTWLWADYVIHHIEKQKIYYEFGKEHCFFVVVT